VRERLRYTLLQVLLIGFCELVFVAAIGVASRVQDPAGAVVFPWYLPLSLVLIAVLTSLPSLLLYDLESSPRWRVRVGLHFLLLAGIVMSAGRLFRWYEDAVGAGVLFAVFCGIYALVWAVVYRGWQRDDARINERLSQRRGDADK